MTDVIIIKLIESMFSTTQNVCTSSFSLVVVLLVVHPLSDELVGDGVGGGHPDGGRLVSGVPRWGPELQSSPDLLQGEPPGLLQLFMVHIHLVTPTGLTQGRS